MSVVHARNKQTKNKTTKNTMFCGSQVAWVCISESFPRGGRCYSVQLQSKDIWMVIFPNHFSQNQHRTKSPYYIWKTKPFLTVSIPQNCNSLFFFILTLGFLPFLMKETVERRQEIKARETGMTLELKSCLLHMEPLFFFCFFFSFCVWSINYMATALIMHYIFTTKKDYVINLACFKGQTCSLV